MISATQLLYLRIGSPNTESQDHDPEPCWMCGGESTRGQIASEWIGGSFTDNNRALYPDGFHVCDACVYICARSSPVPGRLPGKCSKCEGTLKIIKPGRKERKGDPCQKCDGSGMNASGANFRNVSHLLDAGSYTNASKGEKPVMLAWLKAEHRGPWFATIADTGQIHMLPFSPVNADGTRRGIVLFERAIVRLPVPDSAGWTLVDHMTEMLTAGATKEEVTRGDYGPRAWQLCGSALSAFEQDWAMGRGSPWFDLALWLSQRDETEVTERLEKEKTNGKARRKGKGTAADAHSGGAATASACVPADAEEERAQELGSPDLAHEGNDREHNKPRGVVHGDVARAEDREAEPGQLRLFE